MIVWITGLSGSGKTTISKALTRTLRERGKSVVLLDGDQFRQAVGDPHTGHDPQSRCNNAYRICRFAKMLEEQKLIVVVATMSLFEEIHQWNRQNFQDYFEVLVQVDLEILKARDARGLYSRADAGKEAHVGGLDLSVHLPRSPHWLIDNNGEQALLDEKVQALCQIVEERSCQPCPP